MCATRRCMEIANYRQALRFQPKGPPASSSLTRPTPPPVRWLHRRQVPAADVRVLRRSLQPRPPPHAQPGAALNYWPCATKGVCVFSPRGRGGVFCILLSSGALGGMPKGELYVTGGGLGCVVRFAGPQSHPNTIFVVILMWSFLRNATFDQKWSMRGGMGWGSGGGGPH